MKNKDEEDFDWNAFNLWLETEPIKFYEEREQKSEQESGNMLWYILAIIIVTAGVSFYLGTVFIK